MTTSARERVAAFWDDHTARWLRGEDPMPTPLAAWFDSYQGVGSGTPTRDGFPEPYHGDLLGREHTPRMVVLGLNPGEYRPQFQSRDGIFAREIKEKYGSYSRWQTTYPYNRPPWTDIIGRNRYYQARLTFTRNWLQDPEADHRDLLIFESYPWHSKLITGPLRPPAEIIDAFVWQPIAELPVGEVFAFGRPWDSLAQALRLPVVSMLGAGGRHYGSAVPSRAVRVYGLPSGQLLVVEWHAGSAGPPSAKETALLRSVLTGVLNSADDAPPRPRVAGSSGAAPTAATAGRSSS
ncbi:anti-phage DNA glycosylase Brig1 [Micromonospora costi]|uniref:Uncharacterized protein n=1 Tax=Micromonospora costi TaxID=1530042 RepID=A0A3A9ZWF7_9ACTN|nr:hypothetical protein [Micromonospora costi]RKN52649.1 hypothetical protein D7193_22615 [Micromonospora costi]